MNKKGMVLLLCACWAFAPAAAQGPKKALLKAAQKEAAHLVAAESAAHAAFTRELTRRAADAWAERASVPVDIRPTPAEELHPFLPVFNDKQLRRERIRYYHAMREFAELKRTLDVRLFYRRQMHEHMEPADLADLSHRISEVESKLAWNVLVFHDKPSHEARGYLMDALRQLDPFSMPQNVSGPRHLRRQDRTFNVQEFFLHDAENRPAQTRGSFWPGEWRELRRAKELASSLPENVNIAFVNDFLPALVAVNEWKKKGVFGPGRRVMTFQRSEDLLRMMKEGLRVDLVVTDLVMADGGGYYLTSELRSRGYAMPVLALSSYGENEVRAKELFDFGFDGMLSTRPTGGFPLNADGYLTFLTALRNYYGWKNLRGWNR